jgi:very-short-patch-repair endonuclease
MSYLKYLNASKLSAEYFTETDNVKKFLNYIAEKENYKNYEDWYKCTRTVLEKHCTTIFFYNFKGKNIVDLLNIYCDNEYEWIPWKFKQAPGNFWDEINNHKKYMDWLFKELKYETMEDWYKIRSEDIIKNNGSGLIANKYNSSAILMIKTVYPEYNWITWKFNQVCKKFWQDINNQRLYMDWLFKELKYESMEDWYKIKFDVIKKNYGSRILLIYDNSPRLVLESVYPEYKWLPWKFFMVSIGFWNDSKNERIYMDWLFKELKYESMEEWYKISRYEFKKHHGYGLLTLKKYNTNISKLLKSVYPEYNWIESNFGNHKGEIILFEFLSEHFDNTIRHYKFDWCKNSETDKHLPFDFYIPEIKNIIELDGHQHFYKISNWQTPEDARERDIFKMEKALENGYSVIRLTWDDLYFNKINWKKELLSHIKLYETPQIICIGDIYKNHYN